jgi:hypothetical protein
VAGAQKPQATKFCTMAPHNPDSLVWNLLHVTLLAPRILTHPRFFAKFEHPWHGILTAAFVPRRQALPSAAARNTMSCDNEVYNRPIIPALDTVVRRRAGTQLNTEHGGSMLLRNNCTNAEYTVLWFDQS